MKIAVGVIWLFMEYIIQMYNWQAFLTRRYSLKKTLVLFAFFTIVLVGLSFYIYNLPARPIIIVCLIYGVINILYKDKWYKKLCVHMGYFACVIIAETIAILIAKYLYGIENFDVSENSIKNFLWQITAYLLIIIFNMIYVMIFNGKKLHEKSYVARPVILFVTFQVFIFTSVMMIVIHTNVLNHAMLGVLCTIFVCSLASAMVLYNIIRTATLKAAEAEYIKKTSEIRDKHFSEIRAQYVDYKKLRHDFANHLRIVRELKDTDSIISYTNEISNELEKKHIESYCGNLTLDALLAVKKREAVLKDIKINYEICQMSNIGITDFEICSVVANLLDNAIEACEKTTQRYVDFKIKTKMGRLVITSKNSSNGFEGLDTVKADKQNHGLGVGIIKEIAGKYDGDYVYKYEDNSYTAVVNMLIE